MTQNLKVVPQGLIEDGSATIVVDPITGVISYSGNVDAGIAWFSKNYADQGDLKVDPTQLQSANLKLGQEFIFPGTVLQVASLEPGKSALLNVTISNSEGSFKGVAELDLSGTLFSINHVLLNGTADGQQVTLELTSA